MQISLCEEGNMPTNEINEIEMEVGEGEEGEEDFLAGLCKFPPETASMPSQIRIASPYLGFTNLIKSIVVDTEDGPAEIPYDPQKKYDNVIGFIKDELTINFLQNAYAGRGILLVAPNNLKKFYTLQAWEDEFGTDGIAVVLMMRLWWKDNKPEQKKITPVKLGAGGRTTIR